jgi:hypothetical protein
MTKVPNLAKVGMGAVSLSNFSAAEPRQHLYDRLTIFFDAFERYAANLRGLISNESN